MIDKEDTNEDLYRIYCPESFIGDDKEGRPLFWAKAGDISSNFSKLRTLVEEDDLYFRHICKQERIIFRLKTNSIKYNKLIDKQITIFDLSNLSYSIDMNALRFFKRQISSDEAYYPERLYRLYFINAPIFFTAIWAMIKPW